MQIAKHTEPAQVSGWEGAGLYFKATSGNLAIQGHIMKDSPASQRLELGLHPLILFERLLHFSLSWQISPCKKVEKNF